MLPPVILSNLPEGLAAAKARTLQHLSLTHESRKLAGGWGPRGSTPGGVQGEGGRGGVRRAGGLLAESG